MRTYILTTLLDVDDEALGFSPDKMMILCAIDQAINTGEGIYMRVDDKIPSLSEIKPEDLQL